MLVIARHCRPRQLGLTWAILSDPLNIAAKFMRLILVGISTNQVHSTIMKYEPHISKIKQKWSTVEYEL